MNRQALWTVIIGVVLTGAVVAGAFVMLRTVNDPGPENGAQAPEDAGPLTTDALLSEVGDRPDCPASSPSRWSSTGTSSCRCSRGPSSRRPRSRRPCRRR